MMIEAERGLKLSCNDSKDNSQNTSTNPSQETNFQSPSRRSKKLLNDDLLDQHDKQNDSTKIADSVEKSCCSKGFQCKSSEYLFGLYEEDIDSGPSSSHKFYGCKRKGFPSPCSESFGLPDDPIFSNSPIFHERTRKSSLDIDVADPWDICVLDLEYVDQPWLVEYPEVITPYWDVESLFPFEVEDIRQKTEPELNTTKERSLSDSFNISSEILGTSPNTESENVFTSTPVKNQNNSLSVVSTINITSGEDSDVNMAVLKDEVLKALEEAIKKKDSIGNIDMKIKIVRSSSDSKTPETSPTKSSVEVRINDNAETESCKSSSSSKENYFVGKSQETNVKSKKLVNTKELSNATLVDLNEDWQDCLETDINEQSQCEVNNINEILETTSIKGSKKSVKSKKSTLSVVRRSLRSNTATSSDMVTSINNSEQFSCEVSSLKDSRSSTVIRNLCKASDLQNQLQNDISVPNDNFSNKLDDHLGSKRILRSSFQASPKEDGNISQTVKGKDDSNDLVSKLTRKERLTNQDSQDKAEVIDESKIKSRFTNKDFQPIPDLNIEQEDISPSKLKGNLKNMKPPKSSKEERDITKTDNFKRNDRLINTDLCSIQNGTDVSRNIAEQTRKSGKPRNNKIQPWTDKNKSSNILSRTVSDNEDDFLSTQSDSSIMIGDKTKVNKKRNKSFLSNQDDSDTSKNIIERIKRKGILQNGLLSRQSDSTISQNVSDNPTKDTCFSGLLPLSQDVAKNIDNIAGEESRRRTLLKEDFQLSQSQDESNTSKDVVEKRRRGRRPKNKIQEKINDNLATGDIQVDKEAAIVTTNRSIENTLDETETRILRSRSQYSKPPVNEKNERRRRTFSSTTEEHKNIVSTRKRSVSANFDSSKKPDECIPTRRFLRSQAAEPTKVLGQVKSPKAIQGIIKSPKISFDLSKSFKECPKRTEFDSPIKSILKNVFDAAGRLIGVKVHKEKHAKMPSALEIKPEDDNCDDALKKLGTKYEGNLLNELELNTVKKEDDECLKENGITSRIKIVISPLEIKEEQDEGGGKDCPILSTTVPKPKNDAASVRKSGRISNICDNIPQQNTNESRLDDTVKSKRNNGRINTVTTDAYKVEVKDIKIEETATDYILGNFVWAQVAKYPFWPAIICYDPTAKIFQKEVLKQNKPPQTYYHLRFFGDYGRRAWVYRKHIMLYCSRQDLEKIANKMKSENKNYNYIRPYLVTGAQQTIEKWHKAVEELESLRNKKYENIVKHMLESYENYLIARKKRKLHNMLEASSESESEEPDPSVKRRRKKFKSYSSPHITAEAEVTGTNLQGMASQGFDEINITMGGQPNASDVRFRRSAKGIEASTSLDNEQSTKQKDSEGTQVLEMSTKVTPRRSKRSFKPVESLNVPESLNRSLDSPLPSKISEILNVSENLSVSSPRPGERRSMRAIKSSLSNETPATPTVENEKVSSRLVKKQSDEGSEAESKTSSDSTDSNMYSFEYQVELHKKNNLFNGFRNARVCDYCLKQGDLYKCKGRCGGFFHLECASKVTQPHVEKRIRKREKSPSKAKPRGTPQSIESTPKSKRNNDVGKSRNQDQVQIITIKCKRAIGTPKKVNLPANFDELSLSEQIDYGMKEMMSKFENRTIYVDSTDSSSEEGSIIAPKNKRLGLLDSPASSVVMESEKSVSKSSDLDENGEEEKSSDDLEVSMLSDSADTSSKLIKHVTADSVILTESETPMDITNLKCTFCRLEIDPPCFACGLEISKRGSSTRRKCSQFRCGRYYHPYCLKMWPQTQWSIGKWSRNQEQEDSFTCPAHSCHTCFSEELGSAACRLPGDKLVRCMLCPAGFHTTTFCIPAGTDILGGSQIVCPRHRPKPTQPINTIWCFICSAGGNLICCDTCPTSVHPECQPINLTDDDKYICEDCESGRFPLYDEIVWVKLGQYRWWPALVLFPNEVPENVKALKHQRGDFAVRFFGTNDHYWVNKARSFLFQEGDRGGSPGEANKSKNKVYETFGKAIEDAALAYKRKKEFKLRREAESINSLKPPTYVKINRNRPVGNVKSLELDLSNATACECDPSKPHPCGPDGNCINRLLMTECDPDVCPAGIRCRNQAFQKRDYPPMIPYKTQGRGWGLKCLAPIKKGQFVIEYVGELIDSEEYQRRIQKMHEQKEENYYFMTVDSDRMIDAGPKGNLSRFMNHCCNPNCVTQKWTVRGDTCVGLFAKCDIESGSELTFNYNLEVVGQEKKVCKCGATNCSGFIGVKAKSDKPEKLQTDTVVEPAESRKSRKYNRKRAVSPPPLIPPCFMCGRKQSDLTCNNKFCNKGYHLKCLKLDEMPEVSKFACPRHNCNICSNRTIRCCVKCTNSFCPSHSEGNVRHDKFLGFVCRLHDPVISSAETASEGVADKGSKPSTKGMQKSINSYPPKERESIRASWRYYKKRQYDREKIMKKQESTGISGRNRNTTSKQECSDISGKRLKSKNPNNPVKGDKNSKQTENCAIKKYGIFTKGKVASKEREVLRAKWRKYQNQYRLKKRQNLLAQSSSQLNDLTNTKESSSAKLENDSVKNQETFVESVQENEIPIVQNNVVTSESRENTDEVSGVTQSERSRFEPVKSTKRRRQKPESTDESTVSSTTSDEGSHKPIRQKETPNAHKDDTEEPVSSTPPKEPLAIPASNESLLGEPVKSDEELPSVKKRSKRSSGVRNPRKKFRISV